MSALPSPAAVSTPLLRHDPRVLLERMNRAMNTHDAEALAACFAPDYQSEQPAHPARAFRGAHTVRDHWTGIFRNIRDFTAEVVRQAVEGNTAWQEIRWSGHKADGGAFEVRGVIISGTRESHVTWARLYLEPVEHSGETLEAALQRVTRAQP